MRWTPLLLLMPLLAGCKPDAPDRPDQAWVQLGPDGAFARVVTQSDCPSLLADGAPLKTVLRAAKPPRGFRSHVCDAPIPPGTKSLRLGDASLPLPSRADRIVLVGDTGCRMKADRIQDCNNSGNGEPWVFADIARAIAAEKPDLLIHLGDMHYREARCPRNDPRCSGLATGYDEAAWTQDFLEPARPMLAAAPLMTVRGNHEYCGRAWKGYSWLLDALPLADPTWKRCPDSPPPWSIDLDGLRLVNLDSARVEGWKQRVPNEQEVQAYRAAFETIEAAGPSWLVTHRPIWSLTAHGEPDDRKVAVVERTLQHAGAKALPVDAVFGGHLHVLQHVAAVGGRPESFVSGGGGTALSVPLDDGLLSENRDALTELGIDRTGLKYTYRHGYLVATRKDGRYTVRAKALGGDELWAVEVGR